MKFVFINRISARGFTLVELLVVIAIIGLLSTLSIVALNNARMKARDVVRVSNMKQIQTALELYYNDAGQYPASSSVDFFGAVMGLHIGSTVYMTVLPKNPSPQTDGTCVGGPYTYTRINVNSYTLVYCLGGSAGPVGPGMHTATAASIQ